MRTTIVISATLLAATFTYGEQPRQIIATPDAAVTVDGVLDEVTWQNAQVTEPFMYTGSHTDAPIQTRVRVAYDDRALYVAVEADEPAMDAIRAPERERDHEEIWRDDSVELFLTPALGGMEYFHLIHNVSGARHDALQGVAGMPTAWNPKPDWTVAVQRHADGWTSEAAIPFAALGAETPLRGELWGLKIARSLWARGGDRGRGGFTSWSYCPGGYHDPSAWGYLYFGGTNLLRNGDFASDATAKGLPPTWAAALRWRPEEAETGFVRQESLDGANVLHLHKNAEAKGSLLPRAYCNTTVRGGHRYRLLAEMRGDGAANLIFSWRSDRGDGYIPLPARLSDEFRSFAAEIDLPKGVSLLSTMFAFERESAGEMFIRRVELTDLGVPAQVPEADIVHQLTAAAGELVEMKPHDLLADEDGRYHDERLIFTDTGTGTEIRRIDRDWSSGDITYSNRYPWNVDGSAFMLKAWERPGPLYFIADPSGASFRALGIELPNRAPRWGSEPDWLYYGTREAVMRVNWRTREQEEVFRIPDEIKHGGRPAFGWNMELPGLVYYEQGFGPDAPLYYVDLKTGEWTRIPITTDSTGDPKDDWLYSAGLTKLRGEWWIGYSLNHLPHLSEEHPYQQRLSSLDGTVGMNRMALGKPEGAEPQPLYSHGGRSPDGTLECGYHGGAVALWDYNKWEGQILVPGAGGGHIAWMYQNDWFLAGTQGAALSGPFASQLIKVYTDGTWYRVAYGNTASNEYKSNLFANTSPDGTKGAYMSSMLGSIDVYWCVISYPEPPSTVRAQTDGTTVRLSWERPERAAELLGYNVYRSDLSGVGYTRVNDEPVTEQAFSDTPPDAGRTWYYVVTAVERSGLESHRHAGEAVGGAADAAAPERLFVEAEAGELVAPVRENLHGSASNLLFVDYRDGETEGSATWRFRTRNAGPHTLWARMRFQGSGAPDAGWTVSADGQAVGSLKSGSREWEWVRLEAPVPAREGGTQVAIVARDPGLAIDKLLLTDDAGFEPAGRQQIDPDPPATPGGLALTDARQFDTQIAWEVVADADHYQVHRGSSADLEATQASLVGSPARAQFADWGLQAGGEYWYRVAAVDSFGNESTATPALRVQTLPIEGGPVQVALEAEDGTVGGLGEMVDDAEASGGRYVKMAPQGEGDAQVFPTLELEFEAPVAGEYIAWLKLSPVSNRGYAYLNAAMDGGRKNDLLCRFPDRPAGSGLNDTSIWRFVYDMRRELPVRFHLEPGPHTLTVSESHMQEFGIDRVIITNDLGRRPAGRLHEWHYEVDWEGAGG